MKDTANSNPINAMNKAKGTRANTATIILPLNIWYKNVDNIFNKV